jgi:hypothetical protein
MSMMPTTAVFLSMHKRHAHAQQPYLVELFHCKEVQPYAKRFSSGALAIN